MSSGKCHINFAHIAIMIPFPYIPIDVAGAITVLEDTQWAYIFSKGKGNLPISEANYL
ncbi:hypothetical protein [Paraglaciecola sp. MB-3u-78]|uniref:hypothetical protein n=1 Tax=Paraglaciecola sp. MB-3u-78 TaxID=2058332 RepID=UPI0018E3F315|nr:hypothetical protein [Paraglaciecola sp. MB-3u-78]